MAIRRQSWHELWFRILFIPLLLSVCLFSAQHYLRYGITHRLNCFGLYCSCIEMSLNSKARI